VTQAVFLVLLRRAGEIGPKTVLAGWLFKTTLYAVADLRKKQMRRRHHEQEAARMHAATTPPNPPDPQALELLNAALSRLSTADRDALVLRYFEGRPATEIAMTLGGTENAVRQRLFRALARLRKHLWRNGHIVTCAALAATLESTRSAAPAESLTTQLESLIGGTAPPSHIESLAQETIAMLTRAKAVSLLLAAGAGVCLMTAGVSVALLAAPPTTEEPPPATVVAATAATPPTPPTAPAASAAVKVLDVEFVGNHAIDSQVLLDQLTTQPPLTTRGPIQGPNWSVWIVRGKQDAAPGSQENVEADVKTLAGMGLFTSVRAETVPSTGNNQEAGVMVRFIVEERANATQHGPAESPKGTVVAAHAAAVAGDADGLLRCFKGPDDREITVLRQMARVVYTLHGLSEALKVRYGPEAAAQFDKLAHVAVDPGDIPQAKEQIEGESARVTLENSEPKEFVMSKVYGVWKVDPRVLTADIMRDVLDMALYVPRLTKVTKDIQANRYPTAGSALAAVQAILKPSTLP
jgi:RNA polymerase sigma factor (sigma-70 family)